MPQGFIITKWTNDQGMLVELKYPDDIENKFKPGMTWNNYGRNGWHIDHIIPISLWEFETPQDREFKQCWALCNLQPLWESENIAKLNKVVA